MPAYAIFVLKTILTIVFQLFYFVCWLVFFCMCSLFILSSITIDNNQWITHHKFSNVGFIFYFHLYAMYNNIRKRTNNKFLKNILGAICISFGNFSVHFRFLSVIEYSSSVQWTSYSIFLLLLLFLINKNTKLQYYKIAIQ